MCEVAHFINNFVTSIQLSTLNDIQDMRDNSGPFFGICKLSKIKYTFHSNFDI